MDLSAALEQAPDGTVIGGNLDPAGVFHDSTPEEVRHRTEGLLALWATRRTLVPSSGCDIPCGTPIPNIEAFFSTLSQAR
jgi:uroporphyrinogen-III decarboxylase